MTRGSRPPANARMGATGKGQVTSLKAPAKELVWFENAAHMVNSEERELFCKVLVEKVRPIALAGKSE